MSQANNIITDWVIIILGRMRWWWVKLWGDRFGEKMSIVYSEKLNTRPKVSDNII